MLLFSFFLNIFLCQGYELSGEVALKNNHYYYYYSTLPTYPAGINASLADERERKRGLNPADEKLFDLNKQIKKLVVEDKRAK